MSNIATVIDPKPRTPGYEYAHFACPVCGNVWKLPVGNGTPHCAHGNVYVHDPSPEWGVEWTACVRVVVMTLPVGSVVAS